LNDRAVAIELPQPPDNLKCRAVKQVFETYVYAYTLSSVRHEPFIVGAVNGAHRKALSAATMRTDQG
jgi:hypothetical protein